MIGVLALVAVLLALALLGMRYAYRRAFCRRRVAQMDYYRGLDDTERFPGADMMRPMIDDMLALRCERVEIRSFDGLKLVGHYVHTRDGAPLVIMLHGYRSAWQRDFSGLCPLALSLSYNVLMVDQRAHGESEGEAICYGINESRDTIFWIDYAISRFGEGVRIILAGVSMGGAAVLCAVGRGLPRNVVAITADSPFSSAEDIIVKVGTGGRRWLSGIVSLLSRGAARLYARFSVREITPREAILGTKIPILIIHGTADRLVPYEMAEELAKASPTVRLISFCGADHVGSYMLDRDRYISEYKKFLEECRLL